MLWSGLSSDSVGEQCALLQELAQLFRQGAVFLTPVTPRNLNGHH
jgi:hypothetical protein